MKKKTPSLPGAERFREEAEDWLSSRKKRPDEVPESKDETLRFVHELEVHLIELQMQNEELARLRTEAEEASSTYSDLYDFAPVGYFTLARDGAIRQVNLTGTRLLGVERSKLIKRRFALLVHETSRGVFREFLHKVFESGKQESCEIALERTGKETVWVQIEATHSVDGDECTAIVLDISERKQAEYTIEEKNKQLRVLSTSLLAAREEERRKVAREIHDELGQSLTALRIDATWLLRHLPKTEDNQIIHTKCMISLIDSTIGTVQRISSELRPPMLDDLGISATIQWQALEFQRRTGILCSTRNVEEISGFSAAQTITLYRIFQESLTNISRHSGATKVEVRLTRGPARITLEITDDGAGIPESAVESLASIGIIGMRERAHDVNGEFSIFRTGKKGTTVKIVLPVE
jgi:PAS domain S-box-containing protein